MIAFETDVRIQRPIEQVFAYVSDPGNLPHWNSAVQAVRKTSTGEIKVGSTYSMERELPTGRAVNELEIVARERPREFAIRTTSGPTPFRYRYRFSPEGGGTIVHLDTLVELQGLLAQLARRAVKKGVDENLAAVRQILEAAPLHRPAGR